MDILPILNASIYIWIIMYFSYFNDDNGDRFGTEISP